MLPLTRLAARAVPQAPRAGPAAHVRWRIRTRGYKRIRVPDEVAAVLREEHPVGPLQHVGALPGDGSNGRTVLFAAAYVADDGSQRVVTGVWASASPRHSRLHRWSLATRTPVGRPLSLDSDTLVAVCAFRMPGAGVHLASASRGKRVVLWNDATGECVAEILLPSPVALAAFALRDGRVRLVVSASMAPWNPDLRFYNVATREMEMQDQHGSVLRCLAALQLPDGSARVIGGGWDGRVHVYDGDTGARLAQHEGAHSQCVMAATALLDLRGQPRFATCGRNGSVLRWNARTGEQVGEEVVHSRAEYPAGEYATLLSITSCRSRTGTQCIVACGPRHVEMWDAESGLPIGAVQHTPRQTWYQQVPELQSVHAYPGAGGKWHLLGTAKAPSVWLASV